MIFLTNLVVDSRPCTFQRPVVMERGYNFDHDITEDDKDAMPLIRMPLYLRFTGKKAF